MAVHCFSLPVVINYAAVQLVIQCIHISPIQLWAYDILSFSFFPWFRLGRGDYLKEGTYAAWADFGQQGLRANNPLLSNELGFSFLSSSSKKKMEYVKAIWTEHWSHITATVSLLRSERKSNSEESLHQNKTPSPSTCEYRLKEKTKTLQYFGMGVRHSFHGNCTKKIWQNGAGSKDT